MTTDKEFVLRTVEERGVKFIQLCFTDVLGTPKGFSIMPAELENALTEGMIFDGSSVDGFSRIQEADMLLMPDPKTFQILPFQIAQEKVARIICDIKNLDGSPFEGDPRQVLRRALEKIRSQGYDFYAAPELEYFYFKANPSLNQEPHIIEKGSYFDLSISDSTTEIRKITVIALEEMGIPVEHTQHEDAHSQHEIDLRYTDALTMADTVMTARAVIKGVASNNNLIASFMPKPFSNQQGSGMHTHFSVFKGDSNMFYDANNLYGLSNFARQFIAGILQNASAITAVANQWVNSYKRLVPGFEAPIHIAWARNNRSALVRVPPIKSGHPEATRIEYRGADAACNPYLLFALILAAGMDGVQNGYELAPEASQNLYSLSEESLSKLHIECLPKDLDDAIEAMERSELVATTLGEHVFTWFIKNKRDEWDSYRREVTPFEISRYLEIL
jgi:glutamine synthetase